MHVWVALTPRVVMDLALYVLQDDSAKINLDPVNYVNLDGTLLVENLLVQFVREEALLVWVRVNVQIVLLVATVLMVLQLVNANYAQKEPILLVLALHVLHVWQVDMLLQQAVVYVRYVKQALINPIMVAVVASIVLQVHLLNITECQAVSVVL